MWFSQCIELPGQLKIYSLFEKYKLHGKYETGYFLEAKQRIGFVGDILNKKLGFVC